MSTSNKQTISHHGMAALHRSSNSVHAWLMAVSTSLYCCGEPRRNNVVVAPHDEEHVAGFTADRLLSQPHILLLVQTGVEKSSEKQTRSHLRNKERNFPSIGPEYYGITALHATSAVRDAAG
jgi:hypothetical protein